MSLELEVDIDAGIEIEAEVEVEVEVEVEAEVEVEVELEVEAEVEVEIEIEAPEVEFEVEVGAEVEVEIEIEAPQVEFEVEIEAPQVEFEVEIECQEVEVEVEVPDVEVGMNVEIDLNAPINEGEVGGNVADSKMAAYGAAKMGGMGPFCAFMAWFTFMVTLVVCAMFSALGNAKNEAIWGWLMFAVLLVGSGAGVIFCMCAQGKRSMSDMKAEVHISA
jgi:hypothetical protein